MSRLRDAFEDHRDPEAAAAMCAYMRDQFSFYGVKAAALAAIARDVTASLPPPAGDAELGTVALACWDLPEREHQYFAVWYLRRHLRVAGPALMPTLERLITTRSWWDTVDGLATHVVGSLVSAHPWLRATMDRWISSDDVWLARSAILHQERWKERTDAELLFTYCLRRAHDREFFIRKAIGWALRSYAKVAPGAVARFLSAHGHEFSGLSLREARRGIEIGQRRRLLC